MNPNTYSLRSILQSDLDPALCKLMLHQIKSPLLQHSFQLTTDDEYNGGSVSDVNYLEFEQNQLIDAHKSSRNNGFNNQEQKNDLDRLDRKGNKRLSSMSMALSQYEFSRRDYKPVSNNYAQKDNGGKMSRTDERGQKQYGNYKKSRYQQPHNNHNKSEQIIHIHQQNPSSNEINLSLNQIVSPLQCNQQLIFPPQSDIQNRVLQQTISQRYSKKSSAEEGKVGLAIAEWCGQIINAKDAHEEEIYFDRNPNYVRKKIFEKKRSKGLPESNQLRKKYYVTFPEAIEKLYSIQQQQVGGFIELIYRILSILNKIIPHKNNLVKKQGTISKIILKDNPVNYETRQTVCNKNRIINRLRVNKISEVFSRLVTQEPSQKIQSNSFEINIVESDMSKTLQYYSQIQDIIEDYASKSHVVTHLHKIYNLLYDYELQILAQNQSSHPLYNQNGQLISPISTLRSWNNHEIKKPANTQAQKDVQVSLALYSLKDRLSIFLSSLKIDPQQFKNLSELSYIWSQINTNGGYSPTCKKNYITNKQKFITQLCKNDVIIHGKTRGIKQLQIQKKLLEMGFKRNLE